MEKPPDMIRAGISLKYNYEHSYYYIYAACTASQPVLLLLLRVLSVFATMLMPCVIELLNSTP